jgi:alpha-1,3-rhamnosyl/mannosyltransferase
VVFVGYVRDGWLPGLYAGAAAVVYPSWYEGFGLPVVEGLAAGVPVVASTAPALVEVAVAAVRAALAGEGGAPAAREGRRRAAARFRWEDAGRALAGTLLEAGGERRGWGER